MDYNFIKDIYKSIVNDIRADNATLESFIENRDNDFILKHNIESISQILKFLTSSDNIFILNGFMGSGKTYVADFILEFINENVLTFKNSYQEAINLDDILLSMFKDFFVYHNEKKVTLPKTDTNIFSEKINTYIKYSDAPMLFIFDSFEINMRSKDTQKDILDFINYLSHFEKIKIIICSRTFKQSDLISDNNSHYFSLASLNKDEMYEYLEKNKIQGNKFECEELYKVTRGHYILLELSVLIMNLLNMSLTVFSCEYKKSTRNFLEFLVSKILSISSDKFVKLLILLSLLRHGVTSEFIVMQNYASEDDLDFLLSKHVISKKFGKYYLKDYFKTEFIKTIGAVTKMKIHKYLIDAYENELSLKPFDRTMFLSRITMRQEIEYHKEKIHMIEDKLSQSGKTMLNEKQGLTYVSYSKTSGFDVPVNDKKNTEKRYISKIKKQTSNNIFISTDSVTDNITKQLQDISKVKYTAENDEKEYHLTENMDKVPETMDEYILIAQNYENAFNFFNAILYYKKALTFTEAINFNEKEPEIYSKIAMCYKKIQNIDEAVRFYEKVYELYLNSSPNKANEILLLIARIYSESYKFEKAKEFYNRILYSLVPVSPELEVKVYLDIAELENNNMQSELSMKNIEKALSVAEKLSDSKLLSECYFKYALIFDDNNNINMATKYYLRCVQSSNNPSINEYLSSAYSNLADIYLSAKNKTSAKMYFELSVDADKAQNNYEGLYFSYSKLADIYKKENNEKAYEMLVNALSAAKYIDDIKYTASAYIEIGDYYFDLKNYKQALKSYIISKTFVPQHSGEELNTAINMKINKLKLIIGEVDYLKMVDEIKKRR